MSIRNDRRYKGRRRTGGEGMAATQSFAARNRSLAAWRLDSEPGLVLVVIFGSLHDLRPARSTLARRVAG